MFKILDRYLWKATLQGLLIAWVALVTLDLFFSFINEAGKTNALYTTSQAMIYLVYTIPGRFYEHFPNAILIGTLLGLGNLAANSEFIAMRAAGISIKQIIFSVIKLGLLLIVGIFILGEFVVPAADLQARNFKAHLKNKNITLTGGAGLWIKEKNKILHIGNVLSNQQLSDISIYTFNQDRSGLESLKTVSSAKLKDNGWQLNTINNAQFEPTQVNKQQQKEQIETDFIDPQVLDIATIEPEQLSTQELDKIIKHQQSNNIKSDKYELVYWKRFSVPLSALVMLIIAMPFLFGSNRGGGAGSRVFYGIVLGIIFYLVNRAVNELGSVLGISPLLSAFVPSLLFLLGGLIFLNRVR
jgi:lipopolysaccharide export system permease protein